VKVNPKVNIYQPESKEILLFDDGIQVKGQKEQRQAKNKVNQGIESLSALVTKTPAVMTDTVLLQKSPGEFEYIAAPIDANGEDLLTLAILLKLKSYKSMGKTLPD